MIHIRPPRWSLVLFCVTWWVHPAEAQVRVDTTSLANGPPAMQMLLEKTIFKVDVLTLSLRFDPGTTQRLVSMTREGTLSDAVMDSIAATALDARDVWAKIRFVRGVSLNQFVDAVKDNARRANDAGIISDRQLDEVSRNLPVWYAFLEDRRIRDGDEMSYRIRGDTLRTIFVGVDGEVLLDQRDVGAERRLSVMGGYFAPGSDFRKKLIESLFDR